ncbi:MAG: hypothetical protein ACREB2_00270, partial [Pseudolabrys sp.]
MSHASAIAARGRLWPALAVILPLLASQAASAQSSGQNSLFSATPTTGLLTPSPSVGGEPFGPGGVLAPQPEWPPNAARAAAPASPPLVPAGQVALALSARFGKDAGPIDGGLSWRVYAAKA